MAIVPRRPIEDEGGRSTDRLVGPEPGVDEADDPAVALGDDQAGRLEVGRPERVASNSWTRQGPHGAVLGNALVPEPRQGGGVGVAERAEVESPVTIGCDRLHRGRGKDPSTVRDRERRRGTVRDRRPDVLPSTFTS